MAVLVEAISVVVRRAAIDRAFPGGWAAFVGWAPRPTLCFDDDLVRLGFMDQADAQNFIAWLERLGLVFLVDGQAVDFTVVDQFNGPTVPTEWVEFARVAVGGSGDKLSSCWLFEGPRMMVGIHMPGLSVEIATPAGWVYEGSLSQKFTVVPEGQQE